MPYKHENLILCILILIIVFFATLLIVTQIVPTDVYAVEPIVQTVEVEKIVEVPVEHIIEIEIPEKYVYELTAEERELLARITYLEAGGESLEMQEAVASVVINRLNSGKWGNTLKETIYYKNAFSPAPYIYKTTPNNRTYEAVDYVLKNGCTLPSYIYYFRTDHHFNWVGYNGYTVIGNVYFGYVDGDTSS